MALSQSRLQALLAESPIFRSRLQQKMLNTASLVLKEQGVTNHALRAAYAKYVIANTTGATVTAAPLIVQADNLRNTITYEDGGVTTSVLDPDLESQVNSSWNLLAGIDEGT